MARPPNLEPLPQHPSILDTTPIFRAMYGHSVPCSRIQCPKCLRERWYPWSTLRQMLKRSSYTGACMHCAASKRDYPRTSGKTGRRIGSHGYVELRVKAIDPADEPLFHAMRKTCRMVLEHRFVMAKSLGRELHDTGELFENVHHKNGIKTDNRIDNLELWIISQPVGQRVIDIVNHARKILAIYGPEFPS